MKHTKRTKLSFMALTALMLTLAGCSGSGADEGDDGASPSQPNHAPLVVVPQPRRSVTEGAKVSFSVATLFSDPDNDTLAYRALSKPVWLDFDSDTGNVTGSVPLDACEKQCGYEMQVEADDGRGGTAETNVTVLVTAVFKEGGWYGRTTVSATAADGKVYRHTTAGIFGELKQSRDGKDKHDIPGYGPSILQVVFQPDFAEDPAIGYFSDYRQFGDDIAAKQSWYFEVKNQKMINLADRPFTLSLAQLKRVEYKNVEGHITYKEVPMGDDIVKSQLHLLDLDNSCARFTPSDLSSKTFEMKDANGTGVHTRHFRWVLGMPDDSDCVMPPAPTNTRSRSLRSVTPVDNFETAPKKDGKFGLPPM